MSLDELVKQVKKERLLEKKELLQRVETFKSAKDKQSVVLNEAKTKYVNEEARSKRLRSRYDENEVAIKTQENILKQRIGSLDELHGVVRQIANEVDSIIDTSIVTAQKPGRDEGIDKLAGSKELPSIKELEDLWLLVLDEMAESAKVVSFPANIILNTGEEVEQSVTRVGVFNTYSNGHYLRFLPETGKLVEPGRQPTARFQTMASDLENAKHEKLSAGQPSDLYPIALDPTRGEMLALLVQEPNIFERIEQGGLIGYIIIVVGIVGLLIAIIRLLRLTQTNKKSTNSTQS